MSIEFKLNSNCHITIGHTRSLLINTDNDEFIFIPNELSIILEKSVKKTSKWEEFINYLVDKEFLIHKIKSKNFRINERSIETPIIETNLIIDVDKDSKIQEICNRIKSIQFEFVQIRIFEFNETIKDLLDFINEYIVNTFEIICNQDVYYQLILNNEYPNLVYIKIHDSEENKIIENGYRIIELSESKLKSETCCGVVNQANFNFNRNMISLSQKYNSCLMGKFSIDRFGNYKACPSMNVSFGNIENTNISDAILSYQNSNENNKVMITKNQIEHCKVCEFRDVCQDCRAYVNTDYSKPAKCNYNPLNGIWLALLFTCLVSNLFSQTINGKILDEITLIPIEYCKIINESTNSGVFSNVFGEFQIKLSDFSSQNNLKIYYSNKLIKEIKMSFSNDTLNIFITDERIATNLEGVQITAVKWKDNLLNEFRKPDFGNLSLEGGGKISSFISQSDNSKGAIKSIEVFVKKLNPNYRIVLKLYTYDKLNNCPGKELKISNYSLDSLNEAGWVKFNITEKIYLPENGMCVCFEVIPKNRQSIEFNRGICSLAAVEFGAYFESSENGNRTVFSQFSSESNWFNLINVNSKFKTNNVLNLSVKVNINGVINTPTFKKNEASLVNSKRINKKLKGNEVKLNNSTIFNLIKSIHKCIETEDLNSIPSLIVVEKELKSDFFKFIKERENDWLDESEKKSALAEWEYYIQEFESAQLLQVSENFYELEYPNKTKLILYKEDLYWKLSIGYKKLVK